MVTLNSSELLAAALARRSATRSNGSSCLAQVCHLATTFSSNTALELKLAPNENSKIFDALEITPTLGVEVKGGFDCTALSRSLSA